MEENPQPTEQDMEWTQSFSKAIVTIYVLTQFLELMFSFWDPCYTMLYLVRSGVSYGWANFRRPANPAAAAVKSQGLQNVLMKLAVLELWFGIQLNNHSELSVLPCFFLLLFTDVCCLLNLEELWGSPKKMQLGYSNQTHVNM